MNITRTAGVALLLVSGVLAAGCGATTVDGASMEKNIKSTINGPGSVKVATVDCPKDQVAKAGKTFTCSFELTDGSAGEITVTVADEDGTARWAVTRPASGQAEQEVLTGYEEKIGDPVKKVDCPDPLKGGKKAKSICTIELENGSTGKVTVTVNGGDIRWHTQ
jgi:hypothetical protein